MPETRWRVYPVGRGGSLVRATSSALVCIPLIAALMVLPFVAARHVADKGAFGTGAAALAAESWAEYALGIAVLAFALGALAVALLNLVRTVLVLGGLRRAVRQGAPAAAVPHPDQWRMATGWSGASLIVSSVIATAVLAFPVLLTPPVRAWVEVTVADSWRLVGVPVIAIALFGLFQPRRKRAVAELEKRWPERVREAAVSGAASRVPAAPRDASGDPVNPSTIERRPLDALGDKIGTGAVIVTMLAVLAGIFTLPVANSMMDAATGPTRAVQLVLQSSLILLAVAITCYIVGGVLQSIAQTAELRGLLTLATDRTAAPPALGVLSRHWRPYDVPWVNPLGLTGALLLLLGLPALLAPGAARLQNLGTPAVLLAALALVTSLVIDLVAEQRTHEPRNVILYRWPTPNPRTLAKQTDRKDGGAGTADEPSYAAMSDAATESPARPVSGGYPPARTSRRGWGLPKRLRGRGIGDLYR